MSKNAVVVIAIGKSPEWKVSKRSVLKYCKKYDLPLEVVRRENYIGLKPFDPFSNSVNLFEKNQIYELFYEYDRILRLDYDMLITPACPNLFDIVPENKIGGVFEDVGIVQLSRRRMIMNIQKHLGNLDWSSGYINAGMIVASKQHREVFNTSIDEINEVQEIEGIITPEQDYLNYMIRKLGFEVFRLGFKFNHIAYFFSNRFNSYIIHYAGSKVFDEDLLIKRKKADNNELWRADNNKLWRKLTAEQMKRDYKAILKGM